VTLRDICKLRDEAGQDAQKVPVLKPADVSFGS